MINIVRPAKYRLCNFPKPETPFAIYMSAVDQDIIPRGNKILLAAKINAWKHDIIAQWE